MLFCHACLAATSGAGLPVKAAKALRSGPDDGLVRANPRPGPVRAHVGPIRSCITVGAGKIANVFPVCGYRPGTKFWRVS